MKFIKSLKSLYIDSNYIVVLLSFIVSLLIIAASLFCLLNYPQWNNRSTELLFSVANQLSILVTNRVAAIKISILLSIIVFHIVLYLFSLAKQRGRQKDAIRFVSYSLMPSVFWLTAALKIVSKTNLYGDWILLSLFLVFIILPIIAFENKVKYSPNYIKSVIVTCILSVFSASGLFTLLCYTKVFLINDISWQTCKIFSYSSIALLPCFTIVAYFFIRKVSTYKWIIGIPIMLLILLLYLLIIPYPIKIDNEITYNFNAAKILYCIVLPLIACGVFNTIRNYHKQNSISFISLPAFVGGALVCFFWVNNMVFPAVNNMIFEFTARYVPYWSINHGYGELFKDYQITYGISDILGYELSKFFCNDYCMFSNNYGISIFNIIVLLVMFFSYRLIIPWYYAFFLLHPHMHISISLTYFCFFVWPKLFRQTHIWILLWVTISAFLPFFRVPHGTVSVIATIPIFIYQLIRLYRDNYPLFKKMILVLSCILAGLWFSGYREYLLALANMFMEIGSSNQIWAGNHWSLSTNLGNAIIGNLSIAIPLISCLCLFLTFKIKSLRNKTLITAIIIIISIHCFLTLGYGYSRIDGKSFTRQYVSLLVSIPLLYFAFITNISPKRVTLILAIIGLALFSPITSKTPTQYAKSLQTTKQFTAADFIDGKKWGMPQIGKGLKNDTFDDSSLKDLSQVKANMDRLLMPDETFLSISFTGMEYFACEKPMPIEYPGYIFYASESQAVRAIKRLQQEKVNVAFIREDMQVDRLFINTRGHYLFRFALSGKLPVQLDNGVYFMPESYFKKAGIPIPGRSGMLNALKAVPQTNNIGDHPINFGYNAKDILNTLELKAIVKQFSGFTKNNNSTYANIIFDKPVDGAKCGVLFLDIQSDNPKLSAKIYWDNRSDTKFQCNLKNGVNIIPLDISYKWMLNPKINNIKLVIDSPEINNTDNIKIKQVKLYQRKIVSELGLNDFSHYKIYN